MKKKALLISCFNWYKARLETVRQMILKDYDVTVLIADYDHIGKKKIRERYPECTYINVPEYKRNLSISRVRSHIIFGKEVGKRLKSLRPDLIDRKSVV